MAKSLYRGVGGLLATLLFSGMAAAEQIPERTRDFTMPPHEHFDKVLHEVMIDITVMGLVFAAVALVFMFKYKRKAPGDVGHSPKLSPQAMLGWLIIPSALFLADDMFLFAMGWDLHDDYRKVPADAYEVKVTGQLWNWSYEYPNGVATDGELVVPVGKPVMLRMTSADVLHSHYMNKYHVTEDVVPGRMTYEWFMPTEVGESVVTCREYCGMGHSNMYGKIKVVSQQEFDGWMAQQVAALDKNRPAEVARIEAPAAVAQINSL